MNDTSYPSQPEFNQPQKKKQRARMKPGAVPKPPKKSRKRHFTQQPGSKGNRATSKYDKTFDLQAQEIATYGLTDAEMAKVFKISTVTFNAWLKKHKSFAQAVEKGRLPANVKLVMSAHKIANGYEYEECEYLVRVNPKTGERERVLVNVKTKHSPPNLAAIMKILSNRSGGLWGDRIEQQVTNTVNEAKTVTIRIMREDTPPALPSPLQAIDVTAEKVEKVEPTQSAKPEEKTPQQPSTAQQPAVVNVPKKEILPPAPPVPVEPDVDIR